MINELLSFLSILHVHIKEKDVNVDKVTLNLRTKVGGSSPCACKHSSTSSKKNVLKLFFNITFYFKPACKLPKYVLKESKNSFWDHMDPCAYLPCLVTLPSWYFETENFSDSSFHRILESENYRFRFSRKITKPHWISFENSTWQERSYRNFFSLQKEYKILGSICLSEQILYKNSRWNPLLWETEYYVDQAPSLTPTLITLGFLPK